MFREDKSSLRPESPFDRGRQHDAKRQAILSEASRLFNTKGSRATTLSDIARELGLNKTSLYYYVKTKEDLIYQCYLSTLQRWHEILDEAEQNQPGPMPALRQFVRQGLLDWGDQQQGLRPHTAQLLEVASLHEPHRRHVGSEYVRMFERLQRLIDAGIDSGDIRPLESTATVLAVLGALQWAFDWLRTIPENALEATADAVWDILCNGLCRQRPHTFSAVVELPAADANQGGFDRAARNRLKQEAFYQAGTRFFNRKGFVGTSLDEIAEHLNVTKGAFYYHIRNKEDLLLACYTRSLDAMQTLMQQHSEDAPALAVVEHICRGLFCLQNSDAGPLIRYNTITSLPLERRKEVLANTATFKRQMANWIEQAIIEKDFRDIDPQLAERLLSGAINASLEITLWRKAEPLAATSSEYFAVFFDGLSPVTHPAP